MKYTAHETPLTKFGHVEIERVTQGFLKTKLWYAHVINEHINIYVSIPKADIHNMEAIVVHIENEITRLSKQPIAFIVVSEAL